MACQEAVAAPAPGLAVFTAPRHTLSLTTGSFSSASQRGAGPTRVVLQGPRRAASHEERLNEHPLRVRKVV